MGKGYEGPKQHNSLKLGAAEAAVRMGWPPCHMPLLLVSFVYDPLVT